MNTPLAVGLALAAIVLIAAIRLYNRLVARRLAVDNAFATIDVQLKLRCDLVPQVVEAVRGHMEYERGVLEDVTKVRSAAMASTTAGERMALDGQMSGMLGRIFAVAESYPSLKASESVAQLQRSLNEVEAQIAAARRTYNAAVTEYNTAIASFPAVVVAGPLGFGPRSLFEASAADRDPVKIGSFRAQV